MLACLLDPNRPSGAASVTVNKMTRSLQVFCLNKSHGIMMRNCFLFVGSKNIVWINRNSWGNSYFDARGEILGLSNDERPRKHFPRMFSLIKNDSLGIEED